MRRICGLLAMIVVLNSCAHLKLARPEKPSSETPKKVTGSQSAKPYAPGPQSHRR